MSADKRKPTRRERTAAARPAGAARNSRGRAASSGSPIKSPSAQRPLGAGRPARVTAAGPAPAAMAPKPVSAAKSAKSAKSAKVPPFLGPKAKAAAAKPMTGRERRERHQRAQSAAVVGRVLAGVAAAALVLGAVYLVLRSSTAFAIQNIEAEPTAHVSEDTLQKLVQVPQGSTLLNVDTDSIEQALKQDPWVASVDFEKQFPSTLKVTIHEQTIDALAVMSSGSIGWYLGSAGIWIQPVKLTASDGQSTNDAALAQAQSDGCLLITDLPATVSPEAGSVATDEAILAVAAFREGFSSEFTDQIACYSAPSATAIACTLKNGVYVSLGSAEDIASKEKVVTAALEQYGEGQVISINVRKPANAAIKLVGSDDVQAGDGVSVTASAE